VPQVVADAMLDVFQRPEDIQECTCSFPMKGVRRCLDWYGADWMVGGRIGVLGNVVWIDVSSIAIVVYYALLIKIENAVVPSPTMCIISMNSFNYKIKKLLFFCERRDTQVRLTSSCHDSTF
jgi:hypothetical protein